VMIWVDGISANAFDLHLQQAAAGGSEERDARVGPADVSEPHVLDGSRWIGCFHR
jgi:hypothetical protein